jgi:dinuclear metal center YbgI/SA1388 family protein
MVKMKVKEITEVLEKMAPLALQEDYDNAGLLFGDPDAEVTGALVSLDLTPEVMMEAAGKKAGLVISHHPFIFGGIKKIISGSSRHTILSTAMTHGINIYAIHTNLDNSLNGLNRFVCEKLGLKDCRILAPKKGLLSKLVTFCPVDHAGKVRDALFGAGAGHIGNYDSCSYNLEGVGTFRASEQANPYVGGKNVLHREPEVRIEVIFPCYLEDTLIRAMKSVHPYEEPAYDIYPLANRFDSAGAGMTGRFDAPLPAGEFLALVKSVLGIPVIRHTGCNMPVHKVALSTGAGAFLIPEALRTGADAFLTSDLKYHDFVEAGARLHLADIGHYESEQWVKELISEVLIQKFPNFAVSISEKEENPVKYF